MSYEDKVIALLNDEQLPLEKRKKLEEVFPEFKKNDGEEIPKLLHKLLCVEVTMEQFERHGLTVDSALNWLEKQEEKRLTDKVEPKFKVGDKLVSTRNPSLTYKVLEVGNINELGNLEYKVEIFTDGKAGIQSGNTFYEHNIHSVECVKVDEWAELIEQKQEWNESDVHYTETLISVVKKGGQIRSELRREYVDWLASLKCRIAPQLNQKWNDGDEAHVDSIVIHLEQWIERHPNTTGADIQWENVQWLKSLKQQLSWKPSHEQICMLDRVSSNLHLRDNEDAFAIEELTEQLKKL